LRFREPSKSTLTEQTKPVGWLVFPVAGAGGLIAGAVAQLLGQWGDSFGSRNALAYLGWATAVWVSVGFLFAWPAARGRTLASGVLWAGSAMALYLFAWLFTYCAVFGLFDSAGFLTLWRDELVYEIATIPASAVIGLIAAGASRPGRTGSACLAAPLVWSAPELIQSVKPDWLFGPVWGPGRWQYMLALGLPTLLVALLPTLRPSRRINWVAYVATVVIGGAGAFFALRLLDRFVL
jgi:hypothetical protein